jgi:uncharacterized membrane protein
VKAGADGRMAGARPGSRRERAFERRLRRIVAWMVRHWLGLFIVGWGVFIALPVLAPLLAMAGLDRAADAIYFAYRLTCHQLPHRSWFIGGQAHAYDWATISQRLGVADQGEIALYHRPVRDPVLGYQFAYCQRDTATHTALWLTALAYALVGRGRRVRRLPLRVFAAALVPLAIDGMAQLVGWHESTPLSRTLTGALFGVAVAWLLLPELDEGARDLASWTEDTGEPAAGAGLGEPPGGEMPPAA